MIHIDSKGDSMSTIEKKSITDLLEELVKIEEKKLILLEKNVNIQNEYLELAKSKVIENCVDIMKDFHNFVTKRQIETELSQFLKDFNIDIGPGGSIQAVKKEGNLDKDQKEDSNLKPN